MKLYHIDKAKDYRRIMLDVLEVVPRRFRDNIMLNMADILEGGEFTADTFAHHLHRDHLQFFYRLRNSRLFRHVTPHQITLLRSIVDRLEEAYCYDTGEAFRFETAEERQVRRKEWQVRKKEFSKIYPRQSKWSQMHRNLSTLSYFIHCTPIGFLLVCFLVAWPLSLVVANLVSGNWHLDLSFLHLR